LHMTSKRHKRSGGQALVMVTLALMAMAGLMGLAVDLGWSYFVQKQAQAAADGAALAAVQEAVINIRNKGIAPSAFTCGSVLGITCQATPVACSSGAVTATNLENGCLYAKTNGFDYSTASSRQNVTIQSNDHSTLPPTAPGVNNISYWVTVRTVQQIPQLFSAALGNTLGTVSAIATAGIVGSVAPGSFYGMNRRGDCLYDSKGNQYDCGMDIDGSNGSSTSQLHCGSVTADICAPAGIILASDCNPNITDATCNQKNPYAGDGGGAGAWASSLTALQAGGNTGAVKSGTFTPSTPTAAPDGPLFQDQYANIPQPPLQVPSSPIGSCGYPGGTITGDVGLGPYQYYSYHTDSLGNKIPDGKPLTPTGNVTFSTANSGCPGGGFFTPGSTSGSGTNQSTAFPAYIFWGGMDATANKSSLAFGPGQYVMAGTSPNGNGVLFNATQVSGDTATGTMFVFTDGNYPGLSTQTGTIPNFASNMPVLNQGVLGGTDPSSAFKGASIDLSGLVGSSNAGSVLPPAMDVYSSIVWWQDRRNSTVGYNEPAGSPGCPLCTADDGSVLYCNMGCPGGTPPTGLINLASPATSANHVTYTSPQIGIAPGNGHVGLRGIIYQPRGAWLFATAGNSAFQCLIGGTMQQCPLEVVTGAVVLNSGTTGLLLAGPTLPIIRYKAALIQ
jgi:Flp pilus assembly protein TadG